MSLNQDIEDRIALLKKIITREKKALQYAPEGRLRGVTHGKGFQYYCRSGKQNDSEYILAHHGEFMERFNVFSDTALRIIDKKPAPPASKGDLSELKNLLAELIAAADDMDYNEAKRVTEIIETKTYTESLDEKIPDLCKAVDNFDFEEAVEIARGMEGEI